MALSDLDLEDITAVINAEVPGSHGPEGRQAVLAVILNRLNSGKFGKTPQEVLEAENQFQPVTEAGGLAKLKANKQFAPTPQQVLQTKAMLEDFQDPTGGAFFFQNPAKSKIKWEGTPTYSVGPEGQSHVFYKNIKEIRGAKKMAAIPNMLGRGDPSLGDLAQPSPFIQGEPPQDQNQLTSAYEENLAFLKHPSTRAAMLQFALAVVQPRAVGQSVLGHTAQAASQGLEAGGRVETQAEIDRRQGFKEAQEEIATGQRERQLGISEKALGVQERQVGVSEERARLDAQRLLNEDRRLENETKRIDATIKSAEGRERASLIGKLAELQSKRVEKLQEALGVAGDKEKPQITAQLEAAQKALEETTRVYRGELDKLTGGAFATPTTEPAPQKLTIAPNVFDTLMSTSEGKQKLSALRQAGKLSLSPDQEEIFAETERVVPRAQVGPQASIGTKLRGAASEISRDWRRQFGAEPDEAVREAIKGAETEEQWSKLKPEQKAEVRRKLSESMPATIKDLPENQVTREKFWTAVISSPILKRAAIAMYGKDVVDQAEKDLKDMAPRPGKTRSKLEEALR